MATDLAHFGEDEVAEGTLHQQRVLQLEELVVPPQVMTTRVFSNFPPKIQRCFSVLSCLLFPSDTFYKFETCKQMDLGKNQTKEFDEQYRMRL